MLEKGQSRETGNKTKNNKTKIQCNMCWTQLYANTQKNVNKTCTLLQTTGGKDEPTIDFMRKAQRTSQHGTQNVKTHKRTA
jgi:hypothetical protein